MYWYLGHINTFFGYVVLIMHSKIPSLVEKVTQHYRLGDVHKFFLMFLSNILNNISVSLYESKLFSKT